MEGKRSRRNLLICVLVAAVASQMVMTPVMCRKILDVSAEQKNSHALSTHTPASASRANQDSSSFCKSSCSTPSTPSHGGSGSYGTPTPSHGGGGSYGTPTPKHGGGGYYSPPSDGGYTPSPATEPATPTPATTYTPTPTTPLAPPTTYTPTPTTPLFPPTTDTPTPNHGGGGYYSPPSDGGYTPSPATEPATPTPATTYTPTPTTPLFPPTTYTPTPTFPWVPTPGIYTPPSSTSPPPFTGTCDYWGSHPQAIWGILGYWGTLGGLLGATGMPAANIGVVDALRNTRTDGMGALYREGAAAFLNSMVNRRFPFSTPQVRDAFAVALASDQAAANQAQLFRTANEGRLRL